MATENQREEEHEFSEEDSLRQDEDKESHMTFCEKVLDMFKNITVEPTLFMFVVAAMIQTMAAQNLNLEKACRVNLNFTTEICDSLKTQDLGIQNEYERETQTLLAAALTWRTYLTATIPCVLALFAGSFSDQTGHRKFFMIVAFFGQMLVNINCILHTYFFMQVGLEALVLTSSILEGLSGGWCICFLTGFAYISTITTEKNRTFRLGLANFSVTVAFPIGTAASGVMVQRLGYYGCFGFTAGLLFLNILYLLFVVKDPKRTRAQKEHDRKGYCYLIGRFFVLKNVKDTVGVLLKKAPKNRRLRLCVLLGVVSVLFGPLYGEISVMYMSTRYRFNWDEVQFSVFQTYNFVTHSIGTVFSIMVLTKYLSWHDSMLGIVSCMSKIAGAFVYCFAPNDRIFYLAPLVEILNGTALLAMRSIISKLVELQELGKVNSLIGLVENLMPLIYVPMYTQVYTATMEVLPGAVFLVGAAMTLPAVFVLMWLFYEHRKQVGKTKKVSITPGQMT